MKYFRNYSFVALFTDLSVKTNEYDGKIIKIVNENRVLILTKRVLCPECKSNLFRKDMVHSEVYCMQCGLVIHAPAVCGIIYPYFLIKEQNRQFKIKKKDKHYIIKIRL